MSHPNGAPWPAHTVLQVPVPELEPFVAARTAHYDAGFLAADPAFVHAHVTALGPFLSDPGPDALATVAAIAAGTPAFGFRLERMGRFPDGILYLAPEPDDAFRALTAALFAAFPSCLPYGGRYGDVRPHLTLDLAAGDVDERSTRARLGSLVPADCRADRIDLVRYVSGGCRLLARWAFAG